MKKNFPTLSIIVPVYNVEAYLPKCLDSLVHQTYQNLEILVIDDGSTDHSAKIIQQYAHQHPKLIKAYSKENGGLSDARNYGLDKSSGEYIGFVDSDDYVTPDMFAEMISLAEKHLAEMVICNIQKVDEYGNITQKLTQIPNMPEKIILKDYFSVFSDISYFACNKIFKKNLFEGKRFKKGVHFEDIQLIPQLLLSCKIIAQTQTFHYQYLERSSSISKSHTEKGLDILRAVKDVEIYFERSEYKNYKKELKNFQILEGVYTFLAYIAYVKDDNIFDDMADAFSIFIKKRRISLKDILLYTRFDKNYLLYLPLKKKIFYILFFTKQYRIIKTLTKHK